MWENKKSRAPKFNQDVKKRKDVTFKFHGFQGTLHYLQGGTYWVGTMGQL